MPEFLKRQIKEDLALVWEDVSLEGLFSFLFLSDDWATFFSFSSLSSSFPLLRVNEGI